VNELGAIVAIPLPWEHSASGCVEWRLVDWTTPDDAGQRLPILDDGYPEDEVGGPMPWAGDYAILDQKTGEWVFPDGERCDEADLRAAFARRMETEQ
jgi:hypothetical protein